MTIIVSSEAEKKKLIDESRYIHYLECVDSEHASTLMHLYMNPKCILVDEDEAYFE